MKEIKDSERETLQIKFSDDEIYYFNEPCYVMVRNPFEATRYAPLDDDVPKREEGRKEDINYLKHCTEGAQISFVNWEEAIKRYKETYE